MSCDFGVIGVCIMKQLFVWIILGIVPVSLGETVYLSKEDQHRLFMQKKRECHSFLNTTTPNTTVYSKLQTQLTSGSVYLWTLPDGVYCPAVWDGVMCWPETEAGRNTHQPCPSYISSFKTHEFARRICHVNGTWGSPTGSSNGWTNFSSCPDLIFPPVQITDHPDRDVINIIQRHLDEFRLMYNIGFGLSLISLFAAFCVMIGFRKLHCARNYIHLNLFASFFLRAATNLIRENMLVGGLGFPGDFTTENGTLSFSNTTSHWECRVFFSFYQYVLLASYIWIFMEALYLHMLIFVSVFTKKTGVIWYMLIGWTLPLPFVIAWAVSRAVLDNTLCWNISTHSRDLTWINKTPVMLTVIVLLMRDLRYHHGGTHERLPAVISRVERRKINFLFFINIVRLLITKLNTVPCQDTTLYRYRRLARSIVVLIPIFGVYYLVFAFPMDNLDGTASFVMLVIEMFFNSYQGLFISILLCFINAEVRSEIRKAWYRHNLRRGSTMTRGASNVSGIQGHRTSTVACLPDKQTHALKRYRLGGKSLTSVTDLEESVPFTNSSVKTYSVVMNGETPKDGSGNDTVAPEGDKNSELELKIKFVAIECQSRDGMSRNTTSLDIQALKNGCPINETNILNNNMDETRCKGENDFNLDRKEESALITNENTL